MRTLRIGASAQPRARRRPEETAEASLEAQDGGACFFEVVVFLVRAHFDAGRRARTELHTFFTLVRERTQKNGRTAPDCLDLLLLVTSTVKYLNHFLKLTLVSVPGFSSWLQFGTLQVQ